MEKLNVSENLASTTERNNNLDNLTNQNTTTAQLIQNQDDYTNQEQTDAESQLLFDLGSDACVHQEYTVKSNDWFLKILQWLLWKELLKNIPGEDIVQISKDLDTLYKLQTWKHIQPGDKVSLSNGYFTVKDSNDKITFSRPLPIPITNISFTTYTQTYTDDLIDTPRESTNFVQNQIIQWPNNTKPKNVYRQWSTKIDNALLIVSLTATGIVIAAPAALVAAWISAAALGTALMVASITKCIADWAYEYHQNWEISRWDVARLWINIAWSIVDRYTFNSWKKLLVIAWTIIDELADPVWIKVKRDIEKET